MTRPICPVCNEQLEADSRICTSCKTDLGNIIDIKSDAIYHYNRAVSAFEHNRFHDMFFHARRSFTLLSSTESARLLACASVLVDKFNLGYVLWKKVKSL